MTRSVFALALLASVAACTEAEIAQPADAEISVTELYADLGGETAGPVYRQNKEDTLAVSGFDVVSYFTGDGVPIEGARELTVRYQGYDYRFANEDNAKTFIEDPVKYVPAYGGYCAWAMGEKDALAAADPKVYKIVDGTLYLNYDENVQENWEEDIPGFIAKANANYPTHSAGEHYKD